MRSFASWEDVPIFDSEEAEADFWSENRPDLRLMESAVAAASESSDSVTITLRMDPRMLARIKRLARSRYLNYQSMIKQWLSERMEEELRK
jgi:predicted DNA binding CopG/RHH family protein